MVLNVDQFQVIEFCGREGMGRQYRLIFYNVGNEKGRSGLEVIGKLKIGLET